MESAGSWNGPEPIRAFPRHFCRLPISSTRLWDRSQEIAPGAGRLGNCIYIRHSSRRGSPGLCRACVPKPRSCPNERESSGAGVELGQKRNGEFSLFRYPFAHLTGCGCYRPISLIVLHDEVPCFVTFPITAGFRRCPTLHYERI